jgi:hypothetical protein
LHQLVSSIAVGLLVAGLSFKAAFLALSLPALLSLATLMLTYKLYSPHVDTASRGREESVAIGPAERSYLAFAFFSGLVLAQWPLLSYHYSSSISPGAVAGMYALAMLVDAAAAVASGVLFDRAGLRSLTLYPPLAALATATLAFNPTLATALAGAAVWGAAYGLLESASKAGVALVSGGHARSYGLYGISLGLGTTISGLALSAIYGSNILLAAYVALTAMAAALALNTAHARLSGPGARARSA